MRRAHLLLATVMLAGLLLRLRGIGDSYFGDELYTADILFEPSLGGAIDRVRETESTPPLYYVLGWLSGQLGGDTLEMGRLPSVVFGTLAIPATYALGMRTVSQAAALTAAAIVAVAATSIFYGTEARAYALLLFFATAAIVLLLRAAERGDTRAWAGFVACAVLALYSHYTAAFPLAAGLAWVLVRAPGRRRATCAAGAATTLLYLPWVPQIVANPLLELGSIPLTLDSAVRFVFRLLPGHPYVTLPDLPGTVALVVLGAAVVVAAGVAIAQRRGRSRPPGDGVTVLIATGLATPAGLVVYSLLKTDIFQPRYLLAALPMYALLLSAVVTAPRGRLAVATTGAALLAIAAGGVRLAVDDASRRPAYAQAADFLERNARPGDAIADVPLFLEPGPSRTVLDVNLPRERRVAVALPVPLPGGTYGVVLAEREWTPVRRGGSMFVVTPRAAGRYAVPPPPRGLRVKLVRRERFDGFIPVAVMEYRQAAG